MNSWFICFLLIDLNSRNNSNIRVSGNFFPTSGKKSLLLEIVRFVSVSGVRANWTLWEDMSGGPFCYADTSRGGGFFLRAERGGDPENPMGEIASH